MGTWLCWNCYNFSNLLWNIFAARKSYFTLNNSTYENIRISFPITGLWIILFSLPLFIFFKDPKSITKSTRLNLNQSINQLVITFKNLKQYKNIVLFLVDKSKDCFIWMV